ncbi:MAG: hypothetical protein F4114_11700 [Rhodospirillaceae bacterium]|nr:hypothetical protein [Rhodospirillaceae bacterium]MCY4066252.1 hypothetical protein [Rhodospirillaceae bacterium]MXW93210.1 hypothetical protein [Rhodospirillaceae bacterium]MYB11673.1 hypothetical protein [Rhodospirillaceae bacterium]MYI49731.1 hypothetical protein [Rhodospirillaceae bacterium]
MSRQAVIDAVTAELAGDPSYFRAALLREDVERLNRLLDLAADAADETAFLKAAGLAGWTPGDLRTGELRPWLDPFLRAWYGEDPALPGLWREFDVNRLDILAGCLSTRPLAGVARP